MMKTTDPVKKFLASPLFVALLVMLAAFGFYWGWTYLLPYKPRPTFAYFDYQANAWLKGHLHLMFPQTTHDMTRYQGDWYIPFPPLPSILLFPYVAYKGILEVNVVWFACIVGAVTVGLVYLMLRALQDAKLTELDHRGVLWLTVLFGIGSVFWYMAVQGTVWFFAQITTVTFVALGTWLTIRRKSLFWGGVGLGIAMLSRPLIALTAPLLLGLYAELNPKLKEKFVVQDWIKPLLAFAVGPVLAAVALLLYNDARFDNPLDFGYLTQNVDKSLRADLATYGQFHIHFLGRNLKAMLWGIPLMKDGFLQPDPFGISLFITTPALVYLWRSFKPTILALSAWTATGLLMVPLLLYYNTGWYQFGYRFSLDFMIPLMVLLAVHAPTKLPWHYKTLIMLGVVVNAMGVLWFGLPNY